MLARTYGPKFSSYPCFVQPKLNGIRALYQNGTFQSRDEKIWNTSVLQHITTDLARLHPILDNYLLDGELYFHGWSLQRINSACAVNRKEPSIETFSVEYHVFDVVHSASFTDRWLSVSNALRQSDLRTVKVVTTDFVHSVEEMQRYFRRYVYLGYEGIMLRPDGPYEKAKRSRYLYKYKNWQDGEFYCFGVTKGEGKADIGIGALCLETRKHLPFRVGTGFDDELRAHFAENPPIGKLVKIRYLELSDNGVPLAPSFLCVL